jgi:hypothetical protein
MRHPDAGLLFACSGQFQFWVESYLLKKKTWHGHLAFNTHVLTPGACSSAQTLMAFKWANGEFPNGNIMRPATAHPSFSTSTSTHVSAPSATLCPKKLTFLCTFALSNNKA